MFAAVDNISTADEPATHTHSFMEESTIQVHFDLPSHF
jgi:hypothetical protein